MSEQSTTTTQLDALLDAAGTAHANVLIHRAHGVYWAKVEGIDGALGRGESIAAAVADAFVVVEMLARRAAEAQR